MAEKVMVFIDGSYVFYASKRFKKGWRVDFHKLVTALVGPERDLVRPYFYTGIAVPPSPSQVRFHQALEYLGFNVVSRPLKKSRDHWIARGVEAALVTDFLGLAARNAYDTAILVSGDSDYLSAVDEVKRLGKRVEIAGFSHDVDEQLKRIADRFHMLERLAPDIGFLESEKTQ